jgi:hypothetical protein
VHATVASAVVARRDATQHPHRARADTTVDRQVVAVLEAAHGADGTAAEDAVGVQMQRALDALDGSAVVAVAQRARSRRGGQRKQRDEQSCSVDDL